MSKKCPPIARVGCTSQVRNQHGIKDGCILHINCKLDPIDPTVSLAALKTNVISWRGVNCLHVHRARLAHLCNHLYTDVQHSSSSTSVPNLVSLSQRVLNRAYLPSKFRISSSYGS